MPKKDKEPLTSKCQKCGRPITPGLSTCPYCGSPLLPSPLTRPSPLSQPPPSLQRVPPPAYPGLPYQSEMGHANTPKQARKAGDKIGTTTGKEDAETELRRLNKGAAKAQITTAVFLALTFTVASIAGIVAYCDYNATRNEYEARARPYLAIHNLEFTRASENTTYLLVRMTNLGDRPATDIGIENIQLCAISPVECTIIPSIVTENQENTIVYPGRLRTTRIAITEEDYQRIIKADILEVRLNYHYGNEEYMYGARLILQPDNTWDIEQEQEEHAIIKN